jgi:hypothetical protein
MNLLDKYRKLLPIKDKAILPGIIKVADDVKISEQKRNTLKEAINAIASNCVDEINRGDKWHHCPESMAAEAEIDIIEKNIIAGRGALIDYLGACDKWKKAGTE